MHIEVLKDPVKGIHKSRRRRLSGRRRGGNEEKASVSEREGILRNHIKLGRQV